MGQTNNKEELIIQIPRKIFNSKRVQELLSEINLSSIQSKTKASQKDIDNFLAFVKSRRGEVVKPLLKRIKNKV